MGVDALVLGAAAGAQVGLGSMGDKKAPKGGGIPGVTSSTGSGKDGTEGAVPQVDPSIAIDYFKQAADAQASGFDKGLSYYLPALDRARAEIKQGYSDANATLKPLSYASNQALNEQMRMLGLDPLQATAGYGESIRSAASSVLGAGNKSTLDYANNLAQKIDAATALRDPTERAKAKAEVMGMINNAPNILDLNALESTYNSGKPDIGNFNEGAETYQAYLDRKAKAEATFKSNALSNLNNAKSYINELNSLGQDFSANYGDNYDAGYSADQVANKVTQLPGYQFQLNQGYTGLERKASAQGMLKSANTQAALQEFGQNQAMGYYNNYLQQLSGISTLGANATGQIAANQTAQGKDLASISQLYGQAQMDTEREKANYLANTLMQTGTTFYDSSKFNAGLQFTGQQNDLNRANQQSVAGIGAGAPMMNAVTNQGVLGLAQAQFLNSIDNSKAFGQAYLQGAFI